MRARGPSSRARWKTGYWRGAGVGLLEHDITMTPGHSGVCLGKTAVGLCVWALGTWNGGGYLEGGGVKKCKGQGVLWGRKREY